VVLGNYLIGSTDGPRCVSTTIVSSSLLAKIASAAGLETHTVLTGFKWLAKAATDNPDTEMIFGYEEAIGYGVNFAVRDKDGVASALVLAECVSSLATIGKTLDDALDDIYAVHGVHLSAQVSKRFEGDDAMTAMTALMNRLRQSAPAHIADLPVVGSRDLLSDDELPASDVLIYHLDGVRLIVRPSGTEPKIKAYVEAVAQTHDLASSRLEQLAGAAGELLDS